MSEVSEKLLAQIRLERDFIHDLATPLMIAMGMLEFIAEKEDLSEDSELRMDKIKRSLAKMNEITKNRRQTLIAQTNTLKESE